jgi:preprotein translocase YajC subunit
MLLKIWLVDIAIAILPLASIFIFYYLVLWLPEQRTKLASLQFIAQLKPNDWVETKCGLIGQIQAREGDVLIMRSENTTFTIQAWAIAKKLT